MILKRVEISLYGPDEYPNGEDTLTAEELQAGATLQYALVLLNEICSKRLPEGFEIEISPPLDQTGEINVRAIH